jgi:hypothetical protein
MKYLHLKQQIYGNIDNLPQHLVNSLISMFAKCGDLNQAILISFGNFLKIII